MPRYHFHMLNGHPHRDLEGEDLVDDAAARRRALKIMGEVLRDGSIDIWKVGAFRLLCTDHAGVIVTGLVTEDVPAAMAARILNEIGQNE